MPEGSPLQRIVIVVALIVVGPILFLQAQIPDHDGYATADVEQGFKIYSARCTVCHGANGDGIGTADLRSGRYRRAASDRDLARLITTGIPEVGMPPHNLNDPEQVSIVAFLRNWKTFNGGTATLGDAAQGRALFEGRGECTRCHSVDGRTAGLAPDLGKIGSVRLPSALQRSLIDPSAAMHPINRPIHIVTRDGKIINGRRLNEDTYTVQLMDEAGHLLSLDKTNLREYSISTTSTMPSYAETFNTKELADVVAYLASLTGS